MVSPPIRVVTRGVLRQAAGRGRRSCKRVDEWTAPAHSAYWMWGEYQLDVDFCKTSTWYLPDGTVHDTEVTHPSPNPPSSALAPTARYLTIQFGGRLQRVHEVVAYFHANHRSLTWSALKDSTSRITRQDGGQTSVKRYHVHHTAKTPSGAPDLTNNLRSSLAIVPFREHVRLTRADRADPSLPGQRSTALPRSQGAMCVNSPPSCSGELCCTCARG